MSLLWRVWLKKCEYRLKLDEVLINTITKPLVDFLQTKRKNMEIWNHKLLTYQLFLNQLFLFAGLNKSFIFWHKTFFHIKDNFITNNFLLLLIFYIIFFFSIFSLESYLFPLCFSLSKSQAFMEILINKLFET